MGITRRQRRAGAVLLAAMTLLATACGTSQDTGDSSQQTASAASSDQSGGVTDYLEYTQGKSGSADKSLKPVRIGWVNQQGGQLAFPNATKGAQAAVKYINNKLGGINGHPLELATCYVSSTESEGTSCGQQLVNDSSVKTILYGSLLTGSQSLLSVNNGEKPILMANSISSTDAAAKNVFIYNGNPQSIFGGIAAYLKQINAKTVSVLYPQDSRTIAGVQSLQKILKSLGIKDDAVGFDPSATDITAPAVASNAQSNDAVVVLASSPPLCIATAKALDSLAVTSPVIGAGSFCFSEDVAKGLGGEAPKWIQDSVQSNVADDTLADVQAYRKAATEAGLSDDDLTDSDASLAWALVMTSARLLNTGGGESATAASIAKEAEAFTGPMLLGSTEVKCGAYDSAPGLCGAQSREFKHDGNGKFSAVSDWLDPEGL